MRADLDFIRIPDYIVEPFRVSPFSNCYFCLLFLFMILLGAIVVLRKKATSEAAALKLYLVENNTLLHILKNNDESIEMEIKCLKKLALETDSFFKHGSHITDKI